MAKSKKSASPSLAVLDSLPPPTEGEGAKVLLVRNVSQVRLHIPYSREEPELALGLQEEQVFPAGIAKFPALRNALQLGLVEATWVDSSFQIRHIPDPDSAPEPARPENPIDRAYAVEIAYQPEVVSLERIALTVHIPNLEDVDVSFMKNRFARVLKLAQWLEPQLQNRKAVLKALDKRLDEIRVM